MITQFRLNSVTAHGVSGPEAGAIDIIYSYLFKEFGMSVYSYISINQIADNLDEFVSVKSKQCHINIRYSTSSDFDRRDNLGKNKVRLAVVHEALLRLADHDKKLDKEKLELIREKILKNKFDFQFICKESVYKKDAAFSAKIIVSPHTDRFDYYIQILEKGQTICKTKIYCGIPTLMYFKELFSIIKWNGNEEVQISGERKEAIIKLDVKSCGTEVINLTNNPFPPYFQMMRADISEEDHKLAAQIWLNSLPDNLREIVENAQQNFAMKHLCNSGFILMGDTSRWNVDVQLKSFFLEERSYFYHTKLICMKSILIKAVTKFTRKLAICGAALIGEAA